MVSRERVLLIVAADRRELAGIERRTRGAPVVVEASGAGRANAAKLVEKVCAGLPVRAVVSTGVCGGLDPALKIGDVLVVDRVISSEPAAEYAARRPRGSDGLRAGALLTVDHVVLTAEEKQKLYGSGAMAVDMEAAGVAATAQQRGLPFYCVRVVSDAAGQSLEIDYNRARLADGRFSTARIVTQAGLRPARWKELFGLWRATEKASETLGELLERLEFEG